jgi:hypothetical protein
MIMYKLFKRRLNYGIPKSYLEPNYGLIGRNLKAYLSYGISKDYLKGLYRTCLRDYISVIKSLHKRLCKAYLKDYLRTS